MVIVVKGKVGPTIPNIGLGLLVFGPYSQIASVVIRYIFHEIMKFHHTPLAHNKNETPILK